MDDDGRPLGIKIAPTLFPAAIDNEDDEGDDAAALIRDSQTLLEHLDSHLSDLRSLVRRRGHTNDPTLEICSIGGGYGESWREEVGFCICV